MSVISAVDIEKINHISPGAQRVGLGNLLDDALSGALPAGSIALSEIANMTAGKVIAGNGASANTAKTISASAPAFSGTPATVSPTAALSGAPIFSGAELGTHQHAAVTAGTPSGTITGALELASAAFSGTGWGTVGQVVTSTENKTMTLNQCAGMWIVFDSVGAAPPVLILSNTAVVGAPAVLTVQGVPEATGAGTWKIVTMGAATFVGNEMATHQHAAITAGTPAGTNTAPSVTVTGASYTPAGNVAAPTISLA